MDPKMKEILDFLKANNASAELISAAESLKAVNLDSVKEFLEKDEAGRKYLQSQKDAAVTKGIETWKEKTMPEVLEEEIKKRFPEETPEQKRIRELELKQKKLDEEIKRKDLLNKAMGIATEKKLPVKIIDKFLGEDEETTLANIDLLESVYSEAVKNAVEERFKEGGRDGAGSGGGNEKPLDKMSDEEYFATRLENKN